MKLIRIGVLICTLLAAGNAFMDNLYCGKDNCYEVLSINRTATKSEVAKAYRDLARKHHPDRVKGEKAKGVAEKQFRRIAVAYETLKDEQTRKDYDYMLDNPDEVMRHYYYYYRHKAPNVDARLVIAATILLISIIQYISYWHKYREVVSYLVQTPKYRNKAIEIANERGLLGDPNSKLRKKRSKEEVKEEEENILKGIIEENVDVQGGYKRPSLMDTLVVQLVIFPYTFCLYAKWYLQWVWKYWVQRQDYSDEDKLYLIRKRLKMSDTQFSGAFDEAAQEDLLHRELWVSEKFQVWQAARIEEEKAKLATNSNYKRYRRYMRNKGPGQITFMDD